jgi:drug/metabolite transporter (DMT)-like permease
MPRTRANILLLFAAAIWGLGFVTQQTAMEHVGPWFFIALRFAVATLAMAPLALRELRNAQRKVSSGEVMKFALIGFMLFFGMGAQQIGLMTTSVTNAGFLTALYLIFVPILGVILFRQRPHWVIWPAAVTALAGIFLLSGGRLEALSQGDWLTILCAVFWAVQILLIGRFGQVSNLPVTLSVVQFAVTAALAAVMAASLEPIDWSAVRLAAPEILFSGVFAGGIAFTFQTIGQQHTTAPQAALFLSSEALFAAFFGVLLLDDRLPPIAWLGCTLIFAAILAVELVPGWLARRREDQARKMKAAPEAIRTKPIT